MVESILARLLHHEGLTEIYATRILEANPTGVAGELLEGVDALLLTPGSRCRDERGLPRCREEYPQDGNHTRPLAPCYPQARLGRRPGNERLLAQPSTGADAGDRGRPHKDRHKGQGASGERRIDRLKRERQAGCSQELPHGGAGKPLAALVGTLLAAPSRQNTDVLVRTSSYGRPRRGASSPALLKSSSKKWRT
jgi:hypothetical protein